MQIKDQPTTSSIFEVITLVEAHEIIPVIEKGVECEKIELCLHPDSEESKTRIRTSRIVLALLYASKLGINKQDPC